VNSQNLVDPGDERCSSVVFHPALGRSALSIRGLHTLNLRRLLP